MNTTKRLWCPTCHDKTLQLYNQTGKPLQHNQQIKHIHHIYCTKCHIIIETQPNKRQKK